MRPSCERSAGAGDERLGDGLGALGPEDDDRDDGGDDVGDDDDDRGEDPILPATGGGLALVGVLSMALGALIVILPGRRRRRR